MGLGYGIANMDAVPGVGVELIAQPRQVTVQAPQPEWFWPGGGVLSGDNSGDADNPITGVLAPMNVRDGFPLGRMTGTNKWAPSLMGQLGAALANTDTNLIMLTAAEVTELQRRLAVNAGTTFKVTGPPTAAGTVRSMTATPSAYGTGTGQNAVQTLTAKSIATAGTFTLTFYNAAGVLVTTTAIAYNASIATIQAAIDVALGVANGCVASSASTLAPWSTPTPLILTFSGTGYTLKAQYDVVADFSAMTQVTAGYTLAHTTPGVPAAGSVTIAALGVNEVQTVNPGAAAATAGSWQIGVTTPAGVIAWTTPLAFDASLATAQAALDIAAGVTSGVVLTTSGSAAPMSAPASMTATFSGTSYAALPQSLIQIQTKAMTVSSMKITRTVTGVDGRFVAGSWIQAIDGTESPRAILITGQKTGVWVIAGAGVRVDTNFPLLAHEVLVRAAMILGYAGADSSIQAWLKAQLRTWGAHVIFDDDMQGLTV